MSEPAVQDDDGQLDESQSLLAKHDSAPELAIIKVEDLLPEEISALAEANGGHRPSDGLEQVMPHNVEEEEGDGPSRHALYCSHFLSTWGQVGNVPLGLAHALHCATRSMSGCWHTPSCLVGAHCCLCLPAWILQHSSTNRGTALTLRMADEHALLVPQRMWEFAVGLILLELRPGSLALVAAFGLVDSSAQVLAGPFIGAYIDRHAPSFFRAATPGRSCACWCRDNALPSTPMACCCMMGGRVQAWSCAGTSLRSPCGHRPSPGIHKAQGLKVISMGLCSTSWHALMSQCH